MIEMVKKSMKDGNLKITIEGPASAFKDFDKPHRKKRASRKTNKVRVVHR